MSWWIGTRVSAVVKVGREARGEQFFRTGAVGGGEGKIHVYGPAHCPQKRKT
jgi:hypothetical protein